MSSCPETRKKFKMPNTITGKVYNETLKITQKRKSYAETQKEAKEQKKADNRKNSSDD